MESGDVKKLRQLEDENRKQIATQVRQRNRLRGRK
jgi:hypothetical protein